MVSFTLVLVDYGLLRFKGLCEEMPSKWGCPKTLKQKIGESCPLIITIK